MAITWRRPRREVGRSRRASGLWGGVAALWLRQMLALRGGLAEVLGTFALPVLWMVLFGVCMGQTVRDLNTGGGIGYIAFITPGVMLLAGLTCASLGGSALLLDRLSGSLKWFLVAPVPRLSVLLGLLAGSVTKALAQGVVVLGLGVLLGARLQTSLPALLACVALVVAYVVGFAGLAAAFAGRSRGMEGYHGLVMLLNLPVLFVSNALYPLDRVPEVIHTLAHLNPTTYAVDALRALLFGAPSEFGLWTDGAVLFVFFTLGLLWGRGGLTRSARALAG